MGAAASVPNDVPSDEKLDEYYKMSPKTFKEMSSDVCFRNTHGAPSFPKVTSVSTIPPVSEEDKEAFLRDNTSTEYLHSHADSDEIRKRTGSEATVREIQFNRWNDAVNNFHRFVNALRLSGYSDERIDAMLKGRPLCLQSESLFSDLKVALKKLAADLEKETPLRSCCFVFTGSSVPGFSQNPLKGFRDRPSKITSTKKSDVDICIVAHNVSKYFGNLKESNPDIRIRFYPTTTSRHRSSTRCGLRPDSLSLVSKSLAAFHKEWHQKKFKGGLQLTFSEKGIDGIPPWESRIDVGHGKGNAGVVA